MTVEDAIRLRLAMGFTQVTLAIELGMTSRAWQAIELGASDLRQVHILALERIALKQAAKLKNVGFLPESVRKDVAAVSALPDTNLDWIDQHLE